MDIHVGGNSFNQDRPGTRMRIVLRPEGATIGARIRGAAAWLFTLFLALTMGVLCVAIVSYAPSGGPSIAAFVPANCTLLIHTPNGAALHRALVDSPAFNDLLDDPDVAAFIGSFFKTKSNSIDADENDANEKTQLSLRATFDSAYAKLPYPTPSLMPPQASSFYPLVGNESAIALTHVEGISPNEKGHDGALIFTRLSGSRGHIARLVAGFVHPTKSVHVFDLGGGLIAVGLNGAAPADSIHAPPMVVSTHSQNEDATVPLVRISFSPKTVAVPNDNKKQPLDMNNPTLMRLFEEGVPDAVLRALAKPPTTGDMLNWKTPPALARLDIFAAPGGNFVARGRIEGDVPPLEGQSKSERRHDDAFAEFDPNGPMAEFVVPIDLRACFLRHVEGAMHLTRDAEGLTKGQRLWTGRLRTLLDDRVELDESFWPAIGHVAMLEFHESKKDEGATPMGTIKAWLPCDVKNAEFYFAAASLSRSRFDYVFDSTERVTVKTQFVKRFRAKDENGHDEGDRFVLATGKINAPSWSVGTKGFRITTDAGPLALINGPKEADFIAPPKSLDAYRVRLDGPRMAATVESLVTLYYDETEVELGAQKFMAMHPDRKLNIRLANRCANALGKLALEIVPDSTGAELNLSWKPARMMGTASASVKPSLETKEKKESKKTDDDDAPPPPPAN